MTASIRGYVNYVFVRSRSQAQFFHVFMCLVVFGVVRQAELYLTSSIRFGRMVKHDFGWSLSQSVCMNLSWTLEFI